MLSDKKLVKLKNKGLFSLNDLKKINISQSTVSRLISSQKLIRISRGLYLQYYTKIF